MTKPQKVKEGGLSADVRRTLNQLLEYVDSLEPRSSKGVQVRRTSDGFFIEPTGSGNNGNTNNSAPRWG